MDCNNLNMEMKRSVILVCFLVVRTVVFSQIFWADSLVYASCNWSIGDNFEYRIDRETFQVLVNGDTVATQVDSYNLEMEVLSIEDEGLTIKFDYQSLERNNIYYSLDFPSLKAMLAGQVSIIAEIRQAGSEVYVENWREIQDYVKTSYDSLDFSLHVSETEKARMLDSLTSYNSITNFIFPEINQLFAFHGYQYKDRKLYGERIKVENLYPNDTTIRGNFFKRVKYLNPIDDSFFIEYTLIIDPDILKNKIISQLSKEEEEVLFYDKVFSSTSFSGNIYCVSEIDDRGVLLASILVKKIEVGDGVFKEGYRISLLDQG